MDTIKAPAGDGSTRIVDLSIGEEALAVLWGDGHESAFHFPWLRYNCACEICGDPDSGIGTLLITDYPEAIRPEEAALDADGRLVLVWSHGGHRSRFDPDWLRGHCYAEAERRRRRHRPILWDAGLADRIPRASHRAILQDGAARLGAFEALRDYGFLLVEAAPTSEEGLEKLAGTFGHPLDNDMPGRISHVRHSQDPSLVTHTTLAIPKHTDLCYRHAPSGIQFFQCVTASAQGGESLLGDGFRIAQRLRESDTEAFDLLSRVPLQFHRYIEGEVALYAEGRVITLDAEGEVVGFRYGNRVTAAPLDLPGELMVPLHRALRALVGLMNDPELELRLLLRSGDILVFDNHRILHGRAAFADNQARRHIRRCEVMREEFHSRLRLAMQDQGRPGAKTQVLSHGALS